MAVYDVFVSHSSKDARLAERVVNAIEECGYRCWLAPRDIDPGEPYARSIMRGIDGCDVFVVLLSRHSIVSEDVLNEVDNAHGVRKRIIPVFVDDVELPRELNYYLSRTQWVRIGDIDDMSRLPEMLGLRSDTDVATDTKGGLSTGTVQRLLMVVSVAVFVCSLFVRSENWGVACVFVALGLLVVTLLALFMREAFGVKGVKGALLWYGVPMLLWLFAGAMMV